MAKHSFNMPRWISQFGTGLLKGVARLPLKMANPIPRSQQLNGVNVGILITSSYVDSVGFFRGGNNFCSRRKSPRCLLGGGATPTPPPTPTPTPPPPPPPPPAPMPTPTPSEWWGYILYRLCIECYTQHKVSILVWWCWCTPAHPHLV